MKTKVPEGWHLYNFIHGKRYDFTASQFLEEIVYLDITSSRKEAFADTIKTKSFYPHKRSYFGIIIF